MTAYRTHVRLASAAVAASAVLATSLAALVLPGLANADETNRTKRAAVASTSPTRTSTPGATTSAPREMTTSPTNRAGATETPRVKTSNAPGSSASFAPEQEWDVLDPRFNKNQLNLLAGESFVLYADVLHSQPLEQDLSIKISKLANLTCEPKDDTVSAGSDSPLETFAVDCVVTKGQARIGGFYQLRQADGSIIGEGLFGASPQQRQANSTSSAKAQPDGVSTKKAAVPSRTASSSGAAATKAEPSRSTPAAVTSNGTIAIAKGRFTPDSFPVRSGQTFQLEKDVTVSGGSLGSALTMQIVRQQNLDCLPRTAEVSKGFTGTTTLTFECTITGVDRAPGGWYTVTLADGTTLIKDGYFGLDPNQGDIADGASQRPKRDTSGGLAETGAPAAIMVALAGAAVATVTGIQMIRRRNN